MYTDSHCHLLTIEKRDVSLDDLFLALKKERVPYVLDIGTDSSDLEKRLPLLERAKKACGTAEFLHFSAGIWPGPEAIKNRFEELAILLEHVDKALSAKLPLCALGEFGIDRYWNKDTSLHKPEEEMFEMQMLEAQKRNLPVIIHSRDGFEQTLSCIKNVSCSNGVVHCYSYGVKEAKAFLDAGLYISLAGQVTFKKSELPEVLSYIPLDRLLLETDAPYLAPVPVRGQTNTPILVQHIYEFCAKKLGISSEKLCQIVAANFSQLFLSSNCR